MIDERERFEEAFELFDRPEPAWDRLIRRRDRKRRNQRVAAGVVGIAVFVAAIWIVTSVGPLDRSDTSVVPGGDVTGPAEPRVDDPEPPPSVEPAQIGTVTRSGAGCALEVVAEPIRPGAGRLTLVNETDRTAWFHLFLFDNKATYRQFEAIVATGTYPGPAGHPLPPGAFVVRDSGVRPGASGTLIDHFTPGAAYGVVCAREAPAFGIMSRPIALVGPIEVETAPTETGPVETAQPPVRASAAPDVRRHGRCSGGVYWRWILADVGDEIKVQFDLVDFMGDIWQFVLRHGRAGPDFPPFDPGDGRVFFEDTLEDECCGAGILIQESVTDRDGDDGFAAKAVDQRTGQVCKAQAGI